jgi:hypothetical protein
VLGGINGYLEPFGNVEERIQRRPHHAGVSSNTQKTASCVCGTARSFLPGNPKKLSRLLSRSRLSFFGRSSISQDQHRDLDENTVSRAKN